ncbi:MAG TPA: hypothetical protein VGK78_09295 [Nocardioides sp.]|uniref:hypothetical protein n=1 Tax=Nocardioides sp. TaxID=35761 RepID=UPI002F40ECA2
MSARTELAALLARYDDEAWVALANRGLLRRARKDLETLEVGLAEESDTAVAVAVGDRVVRFGTAGPAEAVCSCPSPVICQHVIAAGLWLASSAAEPSPETPSTDDLHEELMNLDAATLTTYAGLPGYRWAHQLLDDLDAPPAVTRDGYLAVTFERPALTVRYLGGGLEGLVLDQQVSQIERVRVAAVLAWQRAHGLVLPTPASRRSGAAESESALSRAESRARCRATVAALLRDTVAVGVSHLSPAIHDRLVTAATWAQGVEYHRLALLLRRLADQVDLLLARSALADDLALLDEVAVAHALVSALEAAAARGPEPRGLVGRARTSYDPVRSLDLVGLGGRPWRTGSGYQGLTCVFWSPARRRVFTWTDARPETLGGFDPRARWQQPAPWTGLATPAVSAGCRLTLTHAQVSADGRLSGVESTAAAVTALDSEEIADLLPVVAAWQELADVRVTSLSEPADPASAWTVLRPAQTLPTHWDPARQVLSWPLLDGDGEVVVLEVPWSRLLAHAIGRLEALGERLPDGALVVARVQRSRRRLVGEPLSVVLPGRALNPVDSLHFDDGPRPVRSSLVARLLKSGTPDRATDAADESPVEGPRSVPVPLAELRALVEQEVQRGCSGSVPGTVHGRLAQAHAALRDVGLAVFADPDPELGAAESLLRSHYLVQQVERALA